MFCCFRRVFRNFPYHTTCINIIETKEHFLHTYYYNITISILLYTYINVYTYTGCFKTTNHPLINLLYLYNIIRTICSLITLTTPALCLKFTLNYIKHSVTQMGINNLIFKWIYMDLILIYLIYN